MNSQLRLDSDLDCPTESSPAVVDLFAGLPRHERTFQLGDEIIPNLPPAICWTGTPPR